MIGPVGAGAVFIGLMGGVIACGLIIAVLDRWDAVWRNWP